ncbi:hypothetical protein [Geminisphaera colitermitum]|uniref:Pam3-gp28 family putative phage holin n=1 Tax=Geminisphaera colitermitum TaxID=1148786 RepID=UPI000158C962|nr:hypothetical protein [Geminisphaera colitermitum]
MNKETIIKLIQQGLTFGGGFLTSSGLASSSEIATGAGAAATLIGVVWTILARKKTGEKITEAETTTSN